MNIKIINKFYDNNSFVKQHLKWKTLVIEKELFLLIATFKLKKYFNFYNNIFLNFKRL